MGPARSPRRLEAIFPPFERKPDRVHGTGSAARPHYALTTLIRYAILGSETQRLTLQEIYDTIEDRFIFFRTAGKGWKNSVRSLLKFRTSRAPNVQHREQVRHNLSLNKCFKRVNRTLL